MACYLPPSTRDLLVRLFRQDVYARSGFVEFPPQAAFRLATEGWELTEEAVAAPDIEPLPFDPNKVKLADHAVVAKPVRVMVPEAPSHVEAFQVGETDNYARHEWRLAVPRLGDGTIAHRASMLAAFKNGKSKTIGMWLAGFACLPGATIDLVGLEYGTSEYEFNYLIEALLSGKNAPVKSYEHLYNDVHSGRMFLELKNGCSFQVRSYKNKDRLRGGQITCYAYNEIYQLPGLEVYTGHAQNLRVEKGFAAFTSTPDKPWVKVLHKRGHGRNPDWFCVCDNNATVNPFSFDLKGMMDDLPDWDVLVQFAPQLLPLAKSSNIEPGALMSIEKFKISWLGQMGGFVGRVYNFSLPAITVTPLTHPGMFRPAQAAEWLAQRAQVEALRRA